jgi:hypothetical protein
VAAWFQKRPHYHLQVAPASGSWLNQVERWFGKIAEQRIRRGVFKSVDELIEAIDEYIAANNSKPKPFIWTPTAELILDRVITICKRTARSPHLVKKPMTIVAPGLRSLAWCLGVLVAQLFLS